jgi:hypothetical protein
MIERGDKLYVVTREDLSPGYQAVQSIHAAQEFAYQFPTLFKEWHERSNFLGLLSVKNEKELRSLAIRAANRRLAVAMFYEPDIDWKLTAIAIEAGSKSATLCKRIRLALS